MRRLLVALALLAAPAPAQEPLERLAARVPADAGGLVVLSDVAASVAETAPLAGGVGAADRRMMPFVTLTLIHGFDLSSAYMQVVKDGLSPGLGFALDQIGQIASWEAGPDKPVVLTGLAERRDAVAAALEGRGFARAARAGRDAWWVLDDFAADPARSASDPFAQYPGHSARIGFDGGDLLFARSWAGLDALLAGGPGLDTDPDAAAILRAGYMVNGRGRFLEAILLGPQGTREQAVRAFVGTGPGGEATVARILAQKGFSVNPFPPFNRHAILLWQDGRRISGALAIAYPDRERAVQGVMAFGPVSMSLVSLFANAPFAGLFPYARWTGIVETGDRVVALIGFEEVRNDDPPTPMMFIINPYDRLRDMLMTGDLALLVAR